MLSLCEGTPSNASDLILTTTIERVALVVVDDAVSYEPDAVRVGARRSALEKY